MAPKEPTRHQLSSRLAYEARTPSFLQRLRNQVAGGPTDEDENEPQYLDGLDEFGRERRPPIPERPDANEGGSDDEDDRDEKPMVVVLKEGKHLTEEEAENERRKAKGLPPLSSKSQGTTSFPPPESSVPKAASGSSKTSNTAQLSFSSNKGGKRSAVKRKVLDSHDISPESEHIPKKSRKKMKGLLSFDDTI